MNRNFRSIKRDLYNKNYDWEKTKFGELNNYFRSLLNTLQQTANATFVINPALATAYSITIDKKKLVFSILIALIGIIFNLGALFYYIYTAEFMGYLIDEINVIIKNNRENEFHWIMLLKKKKALHWLTLLYFILFIVIWVISAAYALHEMHLRF